jgi:hypothetical protein
MRRILVLFLLALLSSPAFANDTPTQTPESELEMFECVPRCLQRTINGLCRQWGSDFCSPYPNTQCIPYCIDRSILGMCRQLGADFCGVDPYCEPYCEDRNGIGQCRRYGSDACYG